jgi:hypothetical protein
VAWHYIAPGKPLQNAFAEIIQRRLWVFLLDLESAIESCPNALHRELLEPQCVANGIWNTQGKIRTIVLASG